MKATFTKRSAAELSGIHEFIAKDNREAADKVVSAILDAADFLAISPDIGRRVRKPSDRGYLYRFHLIRSYRNYLILYRPYPEGIRVVKVMAASKDWTRFFIG